MRLTFLGTGTSFGVPQIGCNCAVCRSPDPRDKRTRVGALVERVTMERVVVAIDAAIAEGFDTFDKWNGRVTGHTSVKEIIHKALTEKTRDQHNRKDSTVVEEAVAKAVAELFAGELKGVMGELVTSFKKQADDVFKARIVEALKGAVGIR